MADRQGRKPKAEHRSASYQRYFEGYTEVSETDSRGRRHIRRVYTAPYWLHDLSDTQWRHRKWIVALLALAAAGLYLAVAFQRVPAQASKVFALCNGVCAFCLLFTLTAAALHTFTPRRMTINQHREVSNWLRRWPFVSAIALEVTCVVTLMYLLFGQLAWQTALLCALGYLLSGALCWGLYRSENRMEYYEDENDDGEVERKPF